MKQVTIKIEESKFQFFMDLIKNFDFVKVESDIDEGDSKEEIFENLIQTGKDLQLLKQGKLETRNVNKLLDEL